MFIISLSATSAYPHLEKHLCELVYFAIVSPLGGRVDSELH